MDVDDQSPILVVPGWGGSGPDHWQSVWQHDLCAPRVELDDWFSPHPETWIAALDAALAALARRNPRPPVLVAHSLGCIAVAHWSRRPRRAIRAAFLVAGGYRARAAARSVGRVRTDPDAPATVQLARRRIRRRSTHRSQSRRSVRAALGKPISTGSRAWSSQRGVAPRPLGAWTRSAYSLAASHAAVSERMKPDVELRAVQILARSLFRDLVADGHESWRWISCCSPQSFSVDHVAEHKAERRLGVVDDRTERDLTRHLL